MSTDPKKTSSSPQVLEFKSSTFSVPVLVLFNNSLQHIEQQLQEKIGLAPDFFKHSPILLDLQELNKRNLDIPVGDLVKAIRELNLLPIGLRGGNAEQNQQALALSIPVHALHGGGSSQENAKTKTIAATPEQPAPNEGASTMLITQPVRSGQRVYSHGDLIVLATVSSGTEIMAEGNIHVYGSLRGRALAGVQGNEKARIFCSDLQAELISIAGIYKVSEDLSKEFRHKPVQIYLQDHSLIIKEI
ncbi:septum site-determining protein MinC [Candidatus Methylomicrobium oryzae]|jgi:septum site-determining protein MinC|uniref:septum site-determining protein MinC n=1 Tax=Candidatus Methylomicrobium oryzae TaxID=2802053 RepID=UPI001924D351|nr:septum site-determining protein MinC [Methylomicrobium sp. RS1]MBL1264800.1 septum site-determining protein MinC [Methylomicrobium sp. RS1]